jgi:hypothetical protein
MTTQVTYNNNSGLEFENAIIEGLKRIFGYCKKDEKHYGEYNVGKLYRVQVISVSEYRDLIRTDDVFANAVKQDGKEDGVILMKDFATKSTEKHIVIFQS